MRYFHLLVFAVLIYWSHSVVTAPRTVSVESHVFIQDDMKNIIVDAINEALPIATNITFEKMWTSLHYSGKILAEFTYSYEMETEDGAQKIEIQGSGELSKYKENNQTAWSLDLLTLGDESITFDEPYLIEAEVL
ncbi:MAG: hypothetical protein AB8E15_05815 [Bdellovibrionales bacterium]